MATPNFSLPELAFEQNFKEVDHNAALRMIDGLLSGVTSRTLTTPPAIVEGLVYIIPIGATGAWSGHDNKVAIAVNGIWQLLTPSLSWGPLWSIVDSAFIRWDGTNWIFVVVPGIGDMVRLVYDTNNNNIVDQAEAIAGNPSDDSFYGKVSGSKGFFNFFDRTRLTPLAGLSTTTGGSLASGDTVIQAFGKVQNQISNILSTTLTGLSTTTGGAVTSSDTILQGIGKVQNQISNILSTTLTGLSTTTGGAITSSLTILQAFGRLQNQLNNISSSVLSTTLTGLSTTTGGAITSSLTILQAFGRLQNQLNNILSTTLTGLSTTTGGAVTSSDTILQGIGKLQNQSRFDFISRLIETPSVKSYTLDESAKRNYRILNISARTASGTSTISITSNGVNVSGLASLSIGTTQVNQNAGTNNVSVGNRVILVVSSSTSALDLSFTIEIEYI